MEGLLNTVSGRGGGVSSQIVLQLLQGQKSPRKKKKKPENLDLYLYLLKAQLIFSQKFQWDHNSHYCDTCFITVIKISHAVIT